MPRHVVLDASEDPAAPVFGFGDRLPFYHTAVGEKLPQYRTDIFVGIDDTIWTVPNYQTDVEVYDLNGHLLGELPSGIDGISPEIVEKATSRQAFAETQMLTRPYRLVAHGDLVAVLYILPAFANIYDTGGNLVRQALHIESAPFLGAMTIDGGMLISKIDHTGTPDEIRDHLGQAYLDAFLAAGYNPSSFAEDNPYLFLLKPVW
jgi:hypothetical protein